MKGKFIDYIKSSRIFTEKKFYIPILSVFVIVIISSFAVYDAVVNTPDKVALNEAEKETISLGEKAKDVFEDETGLDIPSTEEVTNFIGTLGDLDSHEDSVDKEYGKNTYEYFIRNLLPETIDSKEDIAIKYGNIRYLESQDKKDNSVIKADYIPIQSEDNILPIVSNYYLSETGFQKFNDKINYGYVRAGFSSDIISGKIQTKDRTNFELSILVYPKKDMTMKELQEEVNQIPIVIDGVTLEPYYSYYLNQKDDSGKLYKDLIKEIDKKDLSYLSSYLGIDNVPKEDYLNKKVYTGMAIEFTFAGNLNDFFLGENMVLKNGYEYSQDSLPASISLNINDKNKTLKQVRIPENESYLSLDLMLK